MTAMPENWTPEYPEYEQFSEEFEADFPAEEIKLDGEAESHLRSLARLRTDHAEIEERFDTEIARLMARADQTLERLRKRQAWHEGALKAYFVRKGEKRLVLANATLSSVRGRERVEVHDVDALGLWNNTNQQALVEYTPKPLKTDILAYIKDTGELPNGVELVRGEDSFKVKF